MRDETTGQAKLFSECGRDTKGTRASTGSSPELSEHPLSADRGNGTQLEEPTPSRTVSPLAGMSLGEACACCGREVQAPGYVIPDYEELGAFCNQDCADRRFRKYLEEGPE